MSIIFNRQKLWCSFAKQLGILVLWFMLSAGCAARHAELPTAVSFKVSGFSGNWHEVARLPLPFEVNCVAVTFEYLPVRDNKIRVNHYCWYKSLNGPMRKATATVRILRPTQDPGQWLIRFAGPLAGRYNVFYLSDDGRTALVGDPARRYLWVLSRSLSPQSNEVKQAIAAASTAGFDVAELIFSKDLLWQAKQFAAEGDDMSEVER